MTALRRLAPIAAAAAAYAVVVRPVLQTWGATPAEVRASYPGDDLIPGTGSTMATTIDAPPSAVWPWLVQMGADRGGFYSWDRLDNGGRPSAERIHPEWQRIAPGDRVLCVPDGSMWFDVAIAEPERSLVLRSSLTIPSGRPFDPAGRPPRAFSDGLWGFFLRPDQRGGTRLVVRSRGRGRPAGLVGIANWAFWEPAHWVMQRKQFAELRRRAEAAG